MRFFCLAIGYFFGCFLTAEVISRRRSGQSACEVGQKNPGAANITSLYGLKWGVVTLLGDILKTVLACVLCRYVLFPELGRAAFLWAGFGTAAGHGFPFWNRFRGGKSVAVTCTALVLFSPLWGLLSCLGGLFLRQLFKYPAVGAIAIPALCTVFFFFTEGAEPCSLALLWTALLAVLHRGSLKRMLHRDEAKTDLFLEWRNR